MLIWTVYRNLKTFRFSQQKKNIHYHFNILFCFISFLTCAQLVSNPLLVSLPAKELPYWHLQSALKCSFHLIYKAESTPSSFQTAAVCRWVQFNHYQGLYISKKSQKFSYLTSKSHIVTWLFDIRSEFFKTKICHTCTPKKKLVPIQRFFSFLFMNVGNVGRYV